MNAAVKVCSITFPTGRAAGGFLTEVNRHANPNIPAGWETAVRQAQSYGRLKVAGIQRGGSVRINEVIGASAGDTQFFATDQPGLIARIPGTSEQFAILPGQLYRLDPRAVVAQSNSGSPAQYRRILTAVKRG